MIRNQDFYNNLLCWSMGILLLLGTQQLHATDREQVTIQLKWFHQFQFAGYYAAKEKGFYADEGLEVTIRELGPAKGHIQSVLEGDADYGVADANLMLERMQGRPVVLLKQIFQHSPLILMTRQESGITSPYELKGKRVMIGSSNRNVAPDAPLVAMLQDTLGDLDQVQMVDQTFRLDEFVAGQVDAFAGYATNEPFVLQKQGRKINVIDPRNYGIDFYGDNLFTTEKEIQQHPQRVKKMIRATLKGWRYALDHPDEVIDLIRNKYNPDLNLEQLRYEARMTEQMILPDESPLGSVIPNRYVQIARTYLRAGLAPADGDWSGFIHEQPMLEMPPNILNQSGKVRSGSQPESEEDTFLRDLSLQTGLIAIIVLLVIWILFRWLLKSERTDAIAAFSRARLRNSGLIFLALFLAVVLSLAWVALERIRGKIVEDFGASLQTVLNTTTESLDIWVANKQLLLRQIAKDPQIVGLVETLLAAPRDRQTLLGHPATYQLRAHIGPDQIHIGGEGIFIIAPDEINIGSMRDENMGIKNLIAEQRPELLQKVFDGETVFVPPIYTDLQTEKTGDLEHEVTMFVATPVRNLQGRVIAAVTLRLDPAGDFMHLTRLGRFGRSGETYIFDDHARLVSESRFDRQLHDIGLIEKDERSVLQINIRDPGGNLLEGYQPHLPQDQHPLTQMASSAIAKERGINLEGYRDYRGVPVMGAWLWHTGMGIGLTTEIDVEEALETYYTTRTTVLIVLSITVSLAIFGSLTVVLIGERANRALQRARDDLEDKVRERTRKLSLNEAKTRSIVEGMVDGLVTFDSRGTICTINKAIERIFGYRPHELIGENIKLLMPEPFHSENGGYIQRFLQSRRKRFIGSRPKAQGRRKDGTTFPIELGLSEIHTDEETIFTSIITDISQRERAEEELRKLSQAVEQSPVAVVITDLEGTIEYVNPRYTELTGFSAVEAIGRNQRILNSGQQSQTFYEKMFATITAGKTWRGEMRNQKKNGEIYWEEASISPIKATDGSFHHYLSVKENITDRKAAEAALSEAKEQAEIANRTTSEFLANMSHEIRTPMNAIIGLSSLCLKTNLYPKQQDYVSKVHRSAEALLGIINDILDFSKIEAGKLELEEIEFDLEDVLNNLAIIIGINAKKKGLELVIGMEPGTPHNLVGDPLRLSQILTNLANNAVKFTKDGEVSILVSLIGSSEEGIQLRFTIRDTGIGMDTARIETLFAPFNQADSSTTRKYGGSGLGLSICKRLVEMMEGTITLSSQLGQGSTFVVDLHFGDTTTHSELSLPRDISGLRVLVIDDSRTWCEHLTALLKAFKYETQYVLGGIEALKCIEQEPPFDLILLDWKMPGMDGKETARRIHALSHSGSPPPIIVTTNNQEEVVIETETAGIKAVLTKPVTLSFLFDTLMDVLGRPDHNNRRSRSALDLSTESGQGLPGIHLLLVEDNTFNQQVAQELLELNGLKVDIAENGHKAVELVYQNEYAAVLMDIQMPEMDGYEATRLIRQTFSYGDLPIIAMTAGVMEADYRHCMEAGMNDHIGKPVNPQRLFAVLSRWIQGDKSVSSGNETESEGVAPLPLNTFSAEEKQRSDRKQTSISDKSPALNLNVLAEIVGDDPDFLQSLLQNFIIDAEQIVQQTHEAVSNRDSDQVSALGHKLKSSAKAVGANRLAELCSQMEQQGKTGKMDGLNTLLRELDKCLCEVQAYHRQKNDLNSMKVPD